ncbi:LytR C-terminal domain-containing protein [Arthrobacter sp. Sr24]
MSNYPRDEFDAIEENSARHGVHRASIAPQRRSLIPLMVVGIVVLVVGLLAFFVMPKMLNNTTTPPPVAVSETTTAPSSATSAPPTTPAPSTAPVETPTPTPSAEPTPESVVDKSFPVAVYNATGLPGLAGSYAGRVQAEGWTVSESANWNGQPQVSSSIIYSGIEQKANAEELSALLGIPAIAESNEFGIPLMVILGPGA